MADRKKLIAGNWKMNGLVAAVAELDAVIAHLPQVPDRTEVAICPPFTLIDRFAQRAAGTRLVIGAQDVHARESGAHTGCIAAPMLAELRVRAVIVGHSERRTDCYERDTDVRDKARAVIAAGMTAIVCVGETEAERDAGRALDVVGRQLAGSVPEGATAANLVIAYEPVWAIGTGRTPSLEEVAEVHDFIRARLTEQLGAAEAEGVRILYGGSVKPGNARELLSVSNVDGALVGGASLEAAQFIPIIDAAR